MSFLKLLKSFFKRVGYLEDFIKAIIATPWLQIDQSVLECASHLLSCHSGLFYSVVFPLAIWSRSLLWVLIE